MIWSASCMCVSLFDSLVLCLCPKFVAFQMCFVCGVLLLAGGEGNDSHRGEVW